MTLFDFMDSAEPTDLQIALNAADAGNAGDWPTVAAIIAEEYRVTHKLLRRAYDAMEREGCFGDLFLEPIRVALSKSNDELTRPESKP